MPAGAGNRRASLRGPRSTIAAGLPTPIAAINAPSRDSASAPSGVGVASTEPASAPSRVRKWTAPSAPAATISPSGATATAFSGVGKVTIVGAPPASGQIRTVRS
jgi:hypothetical protein